MTSVSQPEIFFAAGDLGDPKDESCLNKVIDLFSGAEIRRFNTVFRITGHLVPLRRQGKEIWIRLDAADPDNILQMISDVSHLVVDFSIQVRGITVPCYPNLTQMVFRARERTLKELLRKKHHRGYNLSDDEIEALVEEDYEEVKFLIFATAALTTEPLQDEAATINRIEMAKEANLDGVFLPPDRAELARKQGLQVAIAGIRDKRYPVQNDYQVVISSIEETAQAHAEFNVLGKPILQAPNPREAAKFFVRGLLRQ